MLLRSTRTTSPLLRALVAFFVVLTLALQAAPLRPVLAHAEPGETRTIATPSRTASKPATFTVSLVPSAASISPTGTVKVNVTGATPTRIDDLTVRLRVLRPNGRIVYQRTVSKSGVKPGPFSVQFEKSFGDLSLREGRYTLDALVTVDEARPQTLRQPLYLVKPSRGAVPLVLVARFSYVPSLDSQGRFVTDPALFTTSRDQAIEIAGILSRMPEVRMCLSMPPLLLDEWRRIISGYQTVGPEGTRTVRKDSPTSTSYAAALTALRRAVRSGRLQLVDVPFSDPDLGGLAAIGGLSDLHDHYARSSSIYLASLGATASPTTAVLGDVVPPAAAAPMAAERMRYVLLRPGALVSRDATPSAGLYDLKGVPLRGVVMDPAAQRLLEDPAAQPDAVLDHMLTRLRSAAATQPLVVPVRFGPGTTTQPAALEAMLRELSRVPWVRFEGLGTLSRTRAMGTRALDPKATAGRAAPAGYWDEVSTARVGAHAFLDAVSERDPDAEAALYAALVAESRSWAGPDNTWSLAERGLAFASSARRRSEVVLSKVSVSAADITLSGTAGKLPLSIKNESGKTLQVVVITRGGHATFPGGPRMRVTLRPADNYVTIPVDLGRGNIYDRVTVSIIAGDVRLATTRLAVRASYLDRIAIVAMVVAVLAGLLFYIRRKVRRAEADT